MADTTNTKVTKSEGWKPIIVAGSGVFSSSKTCNYILATSPPSESLYGHRIDGGDEINYLVSTGEIIYFKSSLSVTVAVTGENEL